MAAPIAFISHFLVKEGKLEAARAAFAAVSGQLGASRPRTAAFLAFMDEDGSRLSILHLFPDAEAMDLHVEGADDRSKAATSSLSRLAGRSTGRQAPRRWP